jgi:hypothetical protein
LQWLKLTHNYRFLSNRPGAPGVYFEVQLKNETGQPMVRIKVPADDANFWVRHRQALLARGLAEDQPIQAPPGEVVAAPHQQVPTVPIWDLSEGRTLYIRTVPEHLIPRDRPVFRPAEWSLMLARSYVRYLCRQHGAASAELIRHTRDAIPPAVLFVGEPPAGTFDDLIATFGELHR